MSSYKNINYVLEQIYLKAPLQKKKLDKYIKSRDEIFLKDFEVFLEEYKSFLEVKELSLDYGINAYLKMVQEMLSAQVKFIKTKKYPILNKDDAFNDVYNNEEEMLSYMIALALSQYLWSSHYEIYMFFRKKLIQNSQNIKNYLEIGPGHGLFLKNAIEILQNDTAITTVDISPISNEISKSIIQYFYPLRKNIDFINKDMLDLDLDFKFDFIIMGEVLEHVENPQRLLKKINRLLTKDGQAVLSTCVNCPAKDHIYHFHTVAEIRKMFNECGLNIIDEKVLPVENLPMEEIILKKITINYTATVKRL